MAAKCLNEEELKSAEDYETHKTYETHKAYGFFSMLPKQHRLPGHLIPQILKTGRWFRGELFDLIIKRRERDKIASDERADFHPRAAQLTVIVPQRLCKKSTKRHRVKRLLVEAVHQLLSQIKPGRQIILMAKKILEKEKLQDIMPEVRKSLEKSQLLNK